MTYISSPVTSKSKTQMWHRLYTAALYAVALLQNGKLVFSPAAHSVGLLTAASFSCTMKLPMDLEFWLKFDLHILRTCDELHVLRMRGWKNSKGMRAEIKEAKRLGIKISYIDKIPGGIEFSHA
jgi:hypothetical protein